jgi:hypothetical protein
MIGDNRKNNWKCRMSPFFFGVPFSFGAGIRQRVVSQNLLTDAAADNSRRVFREFALLGAWRKRRSAGYGFPDLRRGRRPGGI